MKQYINKIVHADCMDILKQLPDKSIDLVVTDPPYKVISGGAYKGHPNKPTGILKKNDGKIFEHNDISFADWLPEVYRILKSNADFYCMTNVLNLCKLNEIAMQCGFKLHNILVWEKNNATPNCWYMKNCEYILYFYKGQAKYIRNAGSKTVHFFSNTKEFHPTEKPVGLMELYINNSSEEGDIILDPFCGSGTTAIACHNLKRRFICIEKDKKYYEVSCERLQNTLNRQFNLLMGDTL